MCLGVPLTAGVEALEVEAGVRPLDIRREELAIRQAAKVMMKDGSTHIKQMWENFTDRETTEQRVTPFGAVANLQYKSPTCAPTQESPCTI